MMHLLLLLAVSGLSVDAIEKFVKSTPTSTTSWGYNANQVVCRDVSVSNQSGRFTFMVCMLFAYGVSLLSCGTNQLSNTFVCSQVWKR
jgi:hypothetical protein